MRHRVQAQRVCIVQHLEAAYVSRDTRDAAPGWGGSDWSFGPGPDLHLTGSCWELVLSLRPGLPVRGHKSRKAPHFPCLIMKARFLGLSPAEHSSRKGLRDHESQGCCQSLGSHGAHCTSEALTGLEGIQVNVSQMTPLTPNPSGCLSHSIPYSSRCSLTKVPPHLLTSKM